MANHSNSGLVFRSQKKSGYGRHLVFKSPTKFDHFIEKKLLFIAFFYNIKWSSLVDNLKTGQIFWFLNGVWFSDSSLTLNLPFKYRNRLVCGCSLYMDFSIGLKNGPVLFGLFSCLNSGRQTAKLFKALKPA
jgi:hypothetical protein